MQSLMHVSLCFISLHLAIFPIVNPNPSDVSVFVLSDRPLRVAQYISRCYTGQVLKIQETGELHS